MRRRLIIIGMAFLAVVIPAIIIVFVVNRNPQLQNAILNLSNVSSNLNIAAANINTTTNTTPAADVEQPKILYVAKTFGELYGNESNQNDFANFVKAQDFGSKSFNDFLNRSIAQQRLTVKTTPYHSYVTNAVATAITRKTAATASVTVTTQRQETLDQQTTTYYQDLTIELLKDGENWKVNAAAWKPKT